MTPVSDRLLVVVSGLAASGKTTVGRLLSEQLSMPLIDKDVILEALFDSLGCETATSGIGSAGPATKCCTHSLNRRVPPCS